MKSTSTEDLPVRLRTIKPAKAARMMRLSSPAFLDGRVLPLQYTEAHLNKNPPLLIDGVPAGAEKLVLLMDERDSGHGILTHWSIFNIEPGTRQICEDGIPCTAQVGANSWGELWYHGPEAGTEERQYFFRLYALDRGLDLPDGVRRVTLEKAMKGHIITEAVLIGKFPGI